MLAMEECQGQRRAHALAARLGASGVMNGPIRLVDGLFGELQRCRLAGAAPELTDFAAQTLADGIDRHAAGNIAGVMSADTIGNHGEAEFAIDGDAIFVERTNPSGIGEADEFKRVTVGIQFFRPEGEGKLASRNIPHR